MCDTWRLLLCDDGQVNTRDRIWRELVFFGGKSGTLEFDALFWREEWNLEFDALFWREE